MRRLHYFRSVLPLWATRSLGGFSSEHEHVRCPVFGGGETRRGRGWEYMNADLFPGLLPAFLQDNPNYSRLTKIILIPSNIRCTYHKTTGRRRSVSLTCQNAPKRRFNVKLVKNRRYGSKSPHWKGARCQHQSLNLKSGFYLRRFGRKLRRLTFTFAPCYVWLKT